MSEKQQLIKGGYSAEVSGYDGNKVLWVVVDDHIVEDPKYNGDIGIYRVGLNIFIRTRRGHGREVFG